MKELINNLRTALAGIEKSKSRYQQLVTEQQGLQTKIGTLTALAGAGDKEAATQLVICKARADMLPSELAQLQSEADGPVAELSSSISAVGSYAREAWKQELEKVGERAGKFLQSELDDAHLVHEITVQIVSNSRSVRRLDMLRGQFNSLTLPGQRTNADTLISKARFAISELSKL